MISEVDGMLQSSKSIIESVDYHRNVISACETILKQLNPVYAKEQERDSAIDDLKSEVESLHKQIAKMTELLSKAETK
jgi:peptidoglycan hydrolase CwlO-like protein